MCLFLCLSWEVKNVEQEKICCACAEKRCFLKKDAEWAKQNYVRASYKNGNLLDRMLFNRLDGERLNEKIEWVFSLGAKGVHQICCKLKTENMRPE